MTFCEFIKEVDFFGKYPEFYIKGKTKQITYTGRIFTAIFILIYILIFIFKIHRMIHRVDITFFDSYSNNDNEKSIHIDNENFYLFFALNDKDDNPFIDETIYYAKAYYNANEMKELQLERCNIEKLGSKYKNLSGEYSLNDYYGLGNINYTITSYCGSFIIKIFPCKNTTENNNHCKSKEIIDKYFDGNTFTIAFEDILITPLQYETPIKEQINLLYTSVYKIFGQYMFVEMELVNIETSTNIIGFDFLTTPKNDNFIKYYSLEVLPEPGYNLDDENNDYPACEVEFTLNDKILVEKRHYIQFLDMLGEIGGLMEFLSSFFGVICNILGNLLYEKTIANNLFSFDIKNKLILIKKENNKPCNNVGGKNKEKLILYNICDSIKIPNMNVRNKLILIDENIKEINDKNSENYLMPKKNILETQSYKNNIEIEKNNKELHKNDFKKRNEKKLSSNIYTTKKLNSLFRYNKKEWIIDIINLKDLFFFNCFSFSNKRKNIYRILLKESNRIIKEKLDILNVFRDLCSIEDMKKLSECNIVNIKMSNNCCNNLTDLK